MHSTSHSSLDINVINLVKMPQKETMKYFIKFYGYKICVILIYVETLTELNLSMKYLFVFAAILVDIVTWQLETGRDGHDTVYGFKWECSNIKRRIKHVKIFLETSR